MQVHQCLLKTGAAAPMFLLQWINKSHLEEQHSPTYEVVGGLTKRVGLQGS